MIHLEPAGVELQAQLFKTSCFGATYSGKENSETKYTHSSYALL